MTTGAAGKADDARNGVIRRVIEEAFGKGELAALDERIAPGPVEDQPRGHDGPATVQP